MAIHKITLSKIIDGVIEYFYPKTTADCVEYTSSQSVLDKLEELDSGSSDLYDITIRLQEAVDKAQESADNAQSTADEALDAAKKAQETADANSESIANIQIEITNLSEAVDNAQSTADEALSTAESNSSSITNIQAVIDVIKDTADEALDTANKAQSAADANVYTSGTGITISSSNVINHSNSVTAGTASGTSTSTVVYGGSFNMPTVTYDAQGHITGSGTTTITMPSISDSTVSDSSSVAASSAAVKAAMDAASAAQAAADGISYSAGTGLSLSGTTFNHSNSVTAGTASGSVTGTLSYGGTFTVPTISYDAQGHITGTGVTTMTMPSVSDSTNSTSSNTAASSAAVKAAMDAASAASSAAEAAQAAADKAQATADEAEGTAEGISYSAGTGLTLDGTTFNHSNSVTAGTASGSATGTLSYGGTFNIPTISYDAQGHITGTGTTTMTMPAEVTSVSTAEKLGTVTVGSSTKPIYLSSGTATASSSTVGSSSAPVYLSSGTITECTGVATSSDLSSLSDTVSELSDEVDGLKENSGSPEIITSLAGCNGFYMEGDLGSVSASNVDDFIESYGLGSSTRKDVYIGCYFTASYNGNTVYFRVAAFDHDLDGYSTYGSQGKYHTVIVPDGYLESSCTMNSSNTTEGAYYGSRMYTETIPKVDGYLQDIFGSHLVQHYNYLTSSVDTSMTNYNYPSYTGVVNSYTLAYYYSILMSEIEVFGKRYYSCENGVYATLLYTPDKQLPLFWHNPKFKVCANRTTNAGTALPSTFTNYYWLRDVASSLRFCNVAGAGLPYHRIASTSDCVRPRFALG